MSVNFEIGIVIAAALTLVGTLVVAILNTIGTIMNGFLLFRGESIKGEIELKKIKPEAIAHRCRVMDADVYTYITISRKHTAPSCPFLDMEDLKTCIFNPIEACADKSPRQRSALAMKAANNGKCYLALFASKNTLL